MDQHEFDAIKPFSRDTTYGPRFFKFCELDHGWSNGLFGDILYWMFRPSSVVEFGSGTGGTLAALHHKGVQVLGLDVSADSIPFVQRHSPEVAAKILVHDLSKPWNPPHPFDLAVSIETLEHVAPEGADTVVHTISISAPIAVVTACPPTYREVPNTLHVNEQPFDYWVTKFAQQGMYLDTGTTQVLRTVMRAFNNLNALKGCPIVPAWYFSANIGVFKKGSK